MNVPVSPLSQAKRGVLSPLATPSTLTSDPGDDWQKAFRVEIAAIAILERLCWADIANQPMPSRQVVLFGNRVVFAGAL